MVEARELARKAIDLGKDDPSVLAKAGFALAYLVGEVEEGAALLARAINLDPNLASARTWRGWTHVYLGEGDAAIEQFQIALRLSPLDRRIYSPQTGMSFAHFFGGRCEDAISWATVATRQQPNFVSAHRILTAALALSGRCDEARQACLQALQIDPTQRISGIAERTPFRRPADIERFAQAFRIAGMPE
jgi:tetratricopeptide (TPR) repeat protein